METRTAVGSATNLSAEVRLTVTNSAIDLVLCLPLCTLLSFFQVMQCAVAVSPLLCCVGPALCDSQLWEARCGLQWRGVWERLVGGLCGEVHLSRRLPSGGRPGPSLPVKRPLDPQALLSQ